MKLRGLCRHCLTLYLLLLVSTSAFAGVVVIVSAKNPTRSLTAEQTTRIFLGKVNKFPNNSLAIPIDQAEGSSIRDEFYAKVAHKSPSQLSAYWAKVIFTGDGLPPKEIDGNVSVREAVAHDPNLIGYIDKSAVNKSVRVILKP